MAINPSSAYSGQVSTTDPTGYPYGKAQNETVGGDGTGTPLEAAWITDVWGFLQSLLSSTSQTPSGTPDKVGASQYLTAIQTLINKLTTTANTWTQSQTFSEDVVVGGSAVAFNFTLGAGKYRQTSRTVTKMVPLSTVSLSGNSSADAGLTNLGIGMGLGATTPGTGVACAVLAFLDLPMGCTFTQVRVGVKSTSGGSSNPIHCAVGKTTLNKTGPGGGASTTTPLGSSSAGTPGSYNILTVTASEPISGTVQIWLEIFGGTDSVALNYDSIQWIEVSYTTTHVDEND